MGIQMDTFEELCSSLSSHNLSASSNKQTLFDYLELSPTNLFEGVDASLCRYVEQIVTLKSQSSGQTVGSIICRYEEGRAVAGLYTARDMEHFRNILNIEEPQSTADVYVNVIEERLNSSVPVFIVSYRHNLGFVLFSKDIESKVADSIAFIDKIGLSKVGKATSNMYVLDFRGKLERIERLLGVTAIGLGSRDKMCQVSENPVMDAIEERNVKEACEILASRGKSSAYPITPTIDSKALSKMSSIRTLGVVWNEKCADPRKESCAYVATKSQTSDDINIEIAKLCDIGDCRDIIVGASMYEEIPGCDSIEFGSKVSNEAIAFHQVGSDKTRVLLVLPGRGGDNIIDYIEKMHGCTWVISEQEDSVYIEAQDVNVVQKIYEDLKISAIYEAEEL